MSVTTQDPHSPRPTKPGAGAWRAELEVVFAADLAKIGARLDLGPADRSFEGIEIGRDEPELALGTARSPLEDPCISRRQLRVSWDAAQGVFRVLGDPAAKRPLSTYSLTGAPLSPDAPGPRLVAVGDRALLLFTVRRAETTPSSIILGASDAMRELRARILTVAKHAEVALVTGPTGSGKELVAREIHAKSGRAGPFLAINAAALPRELVESELFGHVRGAFSGALSAKTGLFQAASGGTLFLDEMGELPLPLQAKLLRAVELRSIRPVGATNETAVDVRIIAATNRNLAAEVAEGRFRADLHQRLLGLHVTVPALSEHRDDIGRLFATFLRRHASPEAEATLFARATTAAPPLPLEFFLSLLRYPFPGNVRELDRLALDVAARGREAAVAPSLHASRPAARGSDIPPTRARASREELVAALERHGHVQHRVARELGIPYATLDRWLREAGVRRPRDLSAEEIREHVAAAGGVEEAARQLGVSSRGLKLRMAELGL